MRRMLCGDLGVHSIAELGGKQHQKRVGPGCERLVLREGAVSSKEGRVTGPRSKRERQATDIGYVAWCRDAKVTKERGSTRQF